MSRAESKESTLERYFQKEELVQSLPPQANYLLALYRYSKGEYKEGLTQLLWAIKKEDQRWDLYQHLVYMGKKCGNLQVTCEKLNYSLNRYKDNYNLHFCLGLANLLDGRVSEAIEELQKSISLNSDCAFARFSLGIAYLECICSSDLEKEKDSLLTTLVHQEFSKAQQGERGIRTHGFQNGMELLDKRLYQQALEKFKQGLEEMLSAEFVFGPFEQVCLYYFVDPGLVDYKMTQKAIQELDERITKKGDKSAYNRLGMAYLLFLRLLFREAEDCFSEARLLAPEFQKPLRNLKSLKEKEKEFSDLFEFLRF